MNKLTILDCSWNTAVATLTKSTNNPPMKIITNKKNNNPENLSEPKLMTKDSLIGIVNNLAHNELDCTLILRDSNIIIISLKIFIFLTRKLRKTGKVRPHLQNVSTIN